jgi:hypothetical protein
MSLKLENVLSENLGRKLLQEAIDTGGIFKDYIPVVVLSEPTKVKYKLSDSDSEQIGEIKLSDEDFGKIMQSGGKPQPTYSFILDVEGNPTEIKLDGKQVNTPENGVSLIKDKVYDILLGDVTSSLGGEEDKESEESTDKEGTKGKEVFINVKNKTEFDKLTNDFDKLKSTSAKLKGMKLSKYADNPNFRKSLVLNLVNSKLTNIKVNGEPISVTLKKLYDNKLLEAPRSRDMNKKQQLPSGWENQVSNFFAELFKVFSILNKYGKNSSVSKEIKKFFKNLYIITREGKSNYSDEKKRDQLFKRIVGNMGNIINYLVSGIELVNKKQQVESIIREVDEKKQIIFTEFEIDAEAVEDSFEEFADTEDIDNDGDFGDDSESEQMKMMRAKEIERRGFNLYGKDAGKLFPRLSFKFKDITTLFGLLGRGDMEGRQEKMKDRYGIYSLDYATSDDTGKTKKMSNLPKYTLQFINEVKVNKDKAFINLKAGEKVVFNYDKNKKVFIHKTSRAKYTNAALIIIEMKTTPKVGEVYDSKIVNMIPLKGEAFSVNPDYKVKFKVIQEGDKETEDNKEEKK